MKHIILSTDAERYLLFNLLYRKFGRLTDWLCRKVTYERIGKLAQRWTKYVE